MTGGMKPSSTRAVRGSHKARIPMIPGTRAGMLANVDSVLERSMIVKWLGRVCEGYRRGLSGDSKLDEQDLYESP